MQGISVIAVAGLAVVALAPLVRFRRAGPVQRQQLKWFAFVVGGCIASVLAAAAIAPVLPAVAEWLVAVASVGAVVGLPIAVGLAILRYRLYDIDRLISRALVYASLTVILGLCYGGLVLALGQLFGRVGERTRAGRWPAPPWPSPPCSSRPAAACRRWLIGASTGASTTPPRPSRRSRPDFATRSTSTRSPPSCWRSLTRPWSRPGSRCGFDLPTRLPGHRSPCATADSLGLLSTTPGLWAVQVSNQLSDGPLAVLAARGVGRRIRVRQVAGPPPGAGDPVAWHACPAARSTMRCRARMREMPTQQIQPLQALSMLRGRKSTVAGTALAVLVALSSVLVGCQARPRTVVLDDFESGAITGWQAVGGGSGGWLVYADGHQAPDPAQRDPNVPFDVPRPTPGQVRGGDRHERPRDPHPVPGPAAGGSIHPAAERLLRRDRALQQPSDPGL